MKKLCGFLVFVLFPLLSHAAVITLCNMPYCQFNYGVTFLTYADAEAFANNGDIIYVQGSSYSYGNITIYKQITLIGAGHHAAKQNPLPSSFNYIGIATSNVQLIGLTMAYLDSNSTSNVVVKKCRVVGENGYNNFYLSYTNNWLIEGNIITSVSPASCIYFSGTAEGVKIQNNILSGQAVKIVRLYGSGSNRAYVLNNIFLGTVTDHALYDLRYVNIENNIFIEESSPGTNGTFQNCFMNNNISYACGDNSFYSPGINNLVNVNPEFVNYPGGGALFDYSHDYSLATTSLGHNTGTDGTDRGVFGGIGFKFTMTGEPAIAEITALNITSGATVAPGGNITISLTSKSVH